MIDEDLVAGGGANEPCATGLEATVDRSDPSSLASRVRLATFVGFIAIMSWRWATTGIPSQRTPLFAWILGAVAIYAIGRTGSRAMRLFWDWAPMIGLLALYDFSRGLADEAGMPLQMASLVRVEEALFGSPIPTIRWQQSIIVPDGPVHWWEAFIAVCYSSHFVVSLSVMGILWFTKRDEFLAFRLRFSIVTLLGLVGYFLVPSAPPWMAADNDLIGSVRRLSLRGFQVFGGEGAEKAITAGARLSNQVAAMPSLHGAWALLIALFFTRFTPRWAWPLLFGYPALMLFTLVATGEHYVIDVLVGFACTGLAFLLARVLEQRDLPWGAKSPKPA